MDYLVQVLNKLVHILNKLFQSLNQLIQTFQILNTPFLGLIELFRILN